MKLKTKRQVVEQIQRCMNKVGKERDALRELVAEAEDILNDCDEAYSSLEFAIEALSRQL